MNPAARLVVSLFIRLSLLFFAGWFAIVEDALPGASLLSRIGIALLFLIASILVGEVSTLRLHFGMFMGALRRASGQGDVVTKAVAEVVEAGAPAGSSDPRDSIDILIQALGADDAQTRQRAHAHLVRLTGQDLPADAGAWGAWWKDNRAGFPGA